MSREEALADQSLAIRLPQADAGGGRSWWRIRRVALTNTVQPQSSPPVGDISGNAALPCASLRAAKLFASNGVVIM